MSEPADSDSTAASPVEPALPADSVTPRRSGAVDLSRAQLLDLRNVLYQRDPAGYSDIADAVYPDGCTDEEIRRAMERAAELWREHMDERRYLDRVIEALERERMATDDTVVVDPEGV